MDRAIYNTFARFPHKFRQPRRGFSLSELVVSVAVLSLMVLLTGQVLNLTVKSTGQATALTNTTQRIRLFEQVLREDLRYVQPGRSVMVIQGNPVNAYWKQSQQEADDGNPGNGYPHSGDPERLDPFNPNRLVKPRADILMYFTARPATSYIDPTVKSTVQQVVLGHARLGDYVSEYDAQGMPQDADQDGGPFRFVRGPEAFPLDGNNAPSSTAVSPAPAEFWHLARRAVILLAPPEVDSTWPKTLRATNPNAAGMINQDRGLQILRGQRDVVDNFNFTARVLEPHRPPSLSSDPQTGVFPWYLPQVFDTTGTQGNFGMIPFQRTQLDPSPPALYASRLGAFLLPNCASFKVEWALDPRSPIVGGRLDGEDETYWIDQGDEGNPAGGNAMLPNPFRAIDDKIQQLRAMDPDHPRANRLEDLIYSPRGGAGNLRYSLVERFRDDADWRLSPAPTNRTNTAVFTASRLDETNPMQSRIVAEDVFPRALRITIDVFDDERRLDRPIRHVMVIPVGG